MKNQIIGNVNLINSTIEFKGENNIFICKSDLTLEHCKVRFTGSNSLIYIDDNPVKKIKENVFYGSCKSTHNFTEEAEEDSKYYGCDSQELYTYERDKNTISLRKIDEDLNNIKVAADKIDYIEKNISNNVAKNRFYND